MRNAVLKPPGAAVDEKFALLCKEAFHGVLVHNGGTIVEANERCASMFACAVDDIIGKNILDFVGPEACTQILENSGTRTEPFECIAVRRSGEKYPIEVFVVSVGASSLRIVAIRDVSGRRISERRQISEEERIRILAQVDFDGIIVHKNDVLVGANEPFAMLIGYTTAELIGMRLDSIVAPEERANVSERIRSHDPTRYESMLIRRDGAPIAVEVCGTSLPNGERVVAIRDNTSTRASEQALRVSEDRFRDLVESCRDLIAAHDLDGTILTENSTAARAMRNAGDTLFGTNLKQHLFEGAGTFSDYVDVLRRDGVASGTTGVIGSDGSRREWEYQSSLRTEGVTAPIARILARDVTDREESLAAVRHSEEHYRSIIENSPDLIAIIDRDGTLRYQSPSIERVLAIKAESVIGRSFADLVHPESGKKALRFLERQLASPAATEMVELRLRHHNGAWRSFEVMARNLTADGVVTSIVTNARDITERKLLEAQLAQATRLSSLGRLAATVAHEFNNVLMGMQPFAELMQRPNASPSAVSKGAWHISNSIQRGKRIAMDILRFTQPSQAVAGLIDLGQWWEKFAPEAEIVLGNTVQLVSEIPSRGTCVVADQEQLSQVMANLVSNARDAMRAGGTLTIKSCEPAADSVFSLGFVADPEQFVQISVSDTGEGIAPEVIDHIFEPLFTTKKIGGTGLGLAVAHQILTQHNGYIFAESEVGRGTTFHLFLPKGRAQCDESLEIPVPHQSSDGLTLLMVEDESPIVEGITAVLNCEGMNVVAVGRGGEAVAAVEKFHPDMVLLDFGLPDMDGSDVYQTLRKVYPLLPVIFASGHVDRRAIHEALADQRTRFLQKPFEASALLQMIAELRPQGAPR